MSLWEPQATLPSHLSTCPQGPENFRASTSQPSPRWSGKVKNQAGEVMFHLKKSCADSALLAVFTHHVLASRLCSATWGVAPEPRFPQRMRSPARPGSDRGLQQPLLLRTHTPAVTLRPRHLGSPGLAPAPRDLGSITQLLNLPPPAAPTQTLPTTPAHGLGSQARLSEFS